MGGSRMAYRWWLLPVLFLYVPLAAQVAVRALGPRSSVARALAGSKLAGVTLEAQRPVISPSAWLQGRFQGQFTEWYAQSFGVRSHLVRVNNQINYSLFGVSEMHGAELLIGKRGQLFERGYVRDQCRLLDPAPSSRLRELAVNLQRLHHEASRRGAAFVLLISPHKAAVYPEYLPSQYQLAGGTAERSVERLLPWLRAYDVPHVVGTRVLLGAKESGGGTPLFCAGATHWNELGAAIGLRALLDQAARQNDGVPRVDLEGWTSYPTPAPPDRDLADLLNVLQPPVRYTSPSVRLAVKRAARPRGKAVFVGTSFNWMPLTLLDRCRAFREIDFYYYYRRQLAEYPGPRLSTPRLEHLDWNAELRNTDLLVLEVNEAGLNPDGPDHCSAFLQDALGQLAGPGGTGGASTESKRSPELSQRRRTAPSRAWVRRPSAGSPGARLARGSERAPAKTSGVTPAAFGLTTPISDIGVFE